jgi:hypothetical protein
VYGVGLSFFVVMSTHENEVPEEPHPAAAAAMIAAIMIAATIRGVL